MLHANTEDNAGVVIVAMINMVKPQVAIVRELMLEAGKIVCMNLIAAGT